MREIVFRGKDLEGWKWVYGYLVNDEIANIHVPYIGYLFGEDDIDVAAVIPETVGQYTGMKDGNGNKIFEGDVLAYNMGEEGEEDQIYVVYWNEYAAAWYIRTPFEALPDSGTEGLSGDKYCRLIGNVFDNPEFAEDKNA